MSTDAPRPATLPATDRTRLRRHRERGRTEPADMDLDVWAGVLPAETMFGPPEPDPALREGMRAPPHIGSFPATRRAPAN